MSERQVQKKYSFLLPILVAIYAACMLIANTAASLVPMIKVLGISAGSLMFPIVYILSDALSEVYGFTISRRAFWTGIAISLFANLFFHLAGVVAQPQFLEGGILSLGLGFTGILISSFVAATIGGYANDLIFAGLKKLDDWDNKGKGYLKRRLCSSAVAEVLDTIIFSTGLWFFVLRPLGVPYGGYFISVIPLQFIFKFGVEVILSPVAHKVTRVLRAVEGAEAFTHNTKFNIFGRDSTSA